MASILRLDSARMAELERWVVGVHVSSDCRRLSTAVVGASGRGLEIRAKVTCSLAKPVPAETASRFEQLISSVNHTNTTSDQLGALRHELAEWAASGLAELLNRAGLAPGQVLAVGVDEPGLWSMGEKGSRGCLGIGDSARLAESTGLNIIDAFPARDLTCGGLGGPVAALPTWLLLRSPQRDQILLDLGRTTRLTRLPAGSGSRPLSRLVSFDIGPGTRLLDLLARRLSGGRHNFDPGGRLGVQGRRIGELLDRWLADPYFDPPPPRWHPYGVDATRFFRKAMEDAVDAGWSVRDMLCSATHFIAETTVRAIQRCCPAPVPPAPILICGGGQQNGMLLREIAARLPGVELVRLNELGIRHEALDAAPAALLALAYIDQVPGNPPSVTGAKACRTLGRLTPGSPQNWQRLLKELTAVVPCSAAAANRLVAGVRH